MESEPIESMKTPSEEAKAMINKDGTLNFHYFSKKSQIKQSTYAKDPRLENLLTNQGLVESQTKKEGLNFYYGKKSQRSERSLRGTVTVDARNTHAGSGNIVGKFMKEGNAHLLLEGRTRLRARELESRGAPGSLRKEDSNGFGFARRKEETSLMKHSANPGNRVEYELSSPPQLRAAEQNTSLMRSNRGLDSMKMSAKKQSIKNTFHPATNLEAVKAYQRKANMSLDDFMAMFLLKIELKRICKRKNSKMAFVMNNPNNTYIKQSKRPRTRNTRQVKPEDTADEIGFDTFDSVNKTSLEQQEVQRAAQKKESRKQIIIKDSGKEIVMQEALIDSAQNVSDEHIILKHERGEHLTQDELERMEAVHQNLTGPLEEEIEEVKANANQLEFVENGEKVVMQADLRHQEDSGEAEELRLKLEQTEEQRRKAEEQALELQKQLEDNLEEMEQMQRGHQKEIAEMNGVMEKIKEQQGLLQEEIEKKNEFISLERNDKEGYSGLLEKLQGELNALKRERAEEKKSLESKHKELEETEQNLGKKIKELAESRSQIYDLKNQIAHLKTKNQKLVLGMSGLGEDSRLLSEMAEQAESEKDILKFTQDEYDDHMKRIENIMTANETEKLLLQKEIERLGGEVADLQHAVEERKEAETDRAQKNERDLEEDTLRLQRKQRELEVMKDQNKKLFEDNKTLSNKYGALKKFRKDIKESSDQLFMQVNRGRELSDEAAINFDFTGTGNPLANIVLATQVFKNDNHRRTKAPAKQNRVTLFEETPQEKPKEQRIRASPPIRSRVSPPPKDHFTQRQAAPRESANSSEAQVPPKFQKKVRQPTLEEEKKQKLQYIEIRQKEVLEVTDYNRQEYLNRSKSPRVV